MDELDEDDVAALFASWRRFPPAPIAFKRLEQILMAAHHLKPAEEPAADAAPQEVPTPEQLQRALDSFNRAATGRVQRV